MQRLLKPKINNFPFFLTSGKGSRKNGKKWRKYKKMI